MKFPFHKSVKLLERWSNGLIAIRKPANVLCHPHPTTKSKYPSILIDTPYDQIGEHFVHEQEDGVRTSLWLLHRLDLGTSGVLLLCTQPTIAAKVKTLFRHRLVTKVYKALCFCREGERQPKELPQSEVWRDLLLQKGPKGEQRTHTAETLFLSSTPVGERMRLLSLQPKTGFQHQLRVQCSLRHLHIVGDDKYGAFHLNKLKGFGTLTGKRLMLHSESISFQLYGQNYHAHAPLEDEKFLPLPADLDRAEWEYNEVKAAEKSGKDAKEKEQGGG